MKKERGLKQRLIAAVLTLVMLISSLLGTTFAWFTDSVTSAGNKIVSGSLKVDLELLDKEGNWSSLKESKDPIFNYENWEPGYVDTKVLKVENEGTLALRWKAKFVSKVALSELADVIDVYVCPSATEIGYPEGRDLAGYERVGTVAEFVNTIEDTTYGNLPAGACAYLGIALKMQESAGNEYQGKTLGAFDIQILATQMSSEEDRFGKDYDADAKFPDEFEASAPVSVNAGAVSEATTVGEESGIHAKVPAGVKVAEGTTALTLSVKGVKESAANVTLSKDEVSASLDVHMAGVAEDNTVPMLITLEGLFSAGLNSTSVKMYHVEDGVTVEMVMVATPTNHNEFSYDPATGNVVMAVASFSEYVTVEDDRNPWEGNADTSWYNENATEFTLENAEDLAGFGILVDGGEDFEGKTVKLGNDISLFGEDANGNRLSFNPIGAHYPGHEKARLFKGTFDGQNHAVKDLYQNGWELGLSYSNAGGGLFAGVQNATFKNLTMDGADIVMEAVPMGTVASYAYGQCTFDNIRITNSTLQNYNWNIGGIVGGVNGQHTFTNIYVDDSATLSELWGSFDGGIGGIVGDVYGGNNGSNKITMENVSVACVMDVYNDVTSAYQWYAYRGTGMLIGNTDEPGADGKHAKTASASFLTCENVKVYYGEWAKYSYCQFTNQDTAWHNNYPWVREQAGLSNSAYSNPRYGCPVINGVTVTENHTHKDGDQHQIQIPFNQLYGGGQGVYGQSAHEGVTLYNAPNLLEITANKKYYDVGHVFTTEDFTVYAIYDDGSKREIANFTISGGNTEAGGKTTVTVHADSKTGTCEVEILEITVMEPGNYPTNNNPLFQLEITGATIDGYQCIANGSYGGIEVSDYRNANSTLDLSATGVKQTTKLNLYCLLPYATAGSVGFESFGYYFDGDVANLTRLSASRVDLGIVNTQNADLSDLASGTHTLTWVIVYKTGIQVIGTWKITVA